MVVASCRITLHLPESRSLKDKRSVLQGLIRRLRDRHNVSVVEIDGRDLWQKAVLGLALAARDQAEAQARLEVLRQAIAEITGLKFFDFETAYHV